VLIRWVSSRVDRRKFTTLDIQEGIGAHREGAIRSSVVGVEHLQVGGEDVLTEVLL